MVSNRFKNFEILRILVPYPQHIIISGYGKKFDAQLIPLHQNFKTLKFFIQAFIYFLEYSSILVPYAGFKILILKNIYIYNLIIIFKHSIKMNNG